MNIIEKLKKFLSSCGCGKASSESQSGTPKEPSHRHPPHHHESKKISEDLIDEVSEESFPSSDPPSWTLGTKPKEHKDKD